jgi:hypothetical protein
MTMTATGTHATLTIDPLGPLISITSSCRPRSITGHRPCTSGSAA